VSKSSYSNIQVTYLNADTTLAAICGADCVWLGLFHVEVKVSYLGIFLANPARILIPLVKAARDEVIRAEPPDDGRFVLSDAAIDDLTRKLQIRIWMSVEEAVTNCPPGCELTSCYLLACSDQPVLAGPIWCSPTPPPPPLPIAPDA